MLGDMLPVFDSCAGVNDLVLPLVMTFSNACWPCVKRPVSLDKKPDRWVYMKVCHHRGMLVAVLTRNEHCPPHVHVGTDKWNARFLFSFWHDGVRLWDVVPLRETPAATVLEEIRQVIKRPVNLRKARECWWLSMKTLCLQNQQWDTQAHEIVASAYRRPGTLLITSSSFDPQQYKTVLYLSGCPDPLEILL